MRGNSDAVRAPNMMCLELSWTSQAIDVRTAANDPLQTLRLLDSGRSNNYLDV